MGDKISQLDDLLELVEPSPLDYREVKDTLSVYISQLMRLEESITSTGRPLDEAERDMVRSAYVDKMRSIMDEMLLFFRVGSTQDFASSCFYMMGLAKSLDRRLKDDKTMRTKK
jgi:hypothetical protein